ncbi:MAG: CRISPR-associated endonuclease Cas2 [bacterium]
MDLLNKMVIVYDIRDDKRRQKVFQTLKNFGTPVQYSVFEARLGAEDMVMLRYLLEQNINAREDSVIFYHQCKHCQERIQHLGIIPEVFGEGDIII